MPRSDVVDPSTGTVMCWKTGLMETMLAGR
jgi:hypothetical protein